MPKLFVVGDSFAVIAEYKRDWLTWHQSLAKQIGYELECVARPGIDQDYQIRELRKIGKISKDDRVLFILTSPQRFWYFKDAPHMSNVVYGTYVQEIVKDKEKLLAIQMFYNHIWREDLFLSFQQSRLSELAWLAHSNGWKNTLVIPAFANFITGEYSNLNLVKGSLYEDIQFNEYKERVEGIDALMNGEWANYDCRFNHFCRSNHERLAEVLIDPILNGTPLDLSQTKFHEDIITNENACDRDFAKDQLNYEVFEKMLDTKFREKLGIGNTLRNLFY